MLPIAHGVITSFFRINDKKYFIITGYDEIDVNYDEDLNLREIEIIAEVF